MNGFGICPICNGSGKVPLSEDQKRYSWNIGKTHEECRNCGGQYMYGKASGKVPLNIFGEPCIHEYIERNAGRCYTIYTCKHCGNKFDIDSGD